VGDDGGGNRSSDWIEQVRVEQNEQREQVGVKNMREWENLGNMRKKKKTARKSDLKPEIAEQSPEETIMDFARILQKSPAAVKCLREAIIKTAANNALDEVFEKAVSGNLRDLG